MPSVFVYLPCLPTTNHRMRILLCCWWRSWANVCIVVPVVVMSSTMSIVLSGGMCCGRRRKALRRFLRLFFLFNLACERVCFIFFRSGRWDRSSCWARCVARSADWLYHFFIWCLRRWLGTWVMISVLVFRACVSTGCVWMRSVRRHARYCAISRPWRYFSIWIHFFRTPVWTNHTSMPWRWGVCLRQLRQVWWWGEKRLHIGQCGGCGMSVRWQGMHTTAPSRLQPGHAGGTSVSIIFCNMIKLQLYWSVGWNTKNKVRIFS